MGESKRGRKPKPKPRVGRTPDILRKSGPMKDQSKYRRKPKHPGRGHDD